MGLFDFFFKKKDGSAKEAKKRLFMVLGYERSELPPNFAERLKNDLINVFSQYPQFDVDNIEVEVKKTGEGNLEELWISIPFKTVNAEK